MIISNYELVEKIAETPQSAIYTARHKRTPERLLVLKVWKMASLSEYTQAQFRQKIEHLKVLTDPLVITPVSLGVKDGACFITQDFFDGVPLNKLAEAQARLRPDHIHQTRPAP